MQAIERFRKKELCSAADESLSNLFSQIDIDLGGNRSLLTADTSVQALKRTLKLLHADGCSIRDLNISGCGVNDGSLLACAEMAWSTQPFSQNLPSGDGSVLPSVPENTVPVLIAEDNEALSWPGIHDLVKLSENKNKSVHLKLSAPCPSSASAAEDASSAIIDVINSMKPSRTVRTVDMSSMT